MPTFLIRANRAEYHFFHRLCIYQDRATEHLRPNSRKKKTLCYDLARAEKATDGKKYVKTKVDVRLCHLPRETKVDATKCHACLAKLCVDSVWTKRVVTTCVATKCLLRKCMLTICFFSVRHLLGFRQVIAQVRLCISELCRNMLSLRIGSMKREQMDP